MTYEIYRYSIIGGAVLDGIMAAVSVFVFFLLKIPTVIGDLTGANARKAIDDIRSHNESTGNKTHRTSQINQERGKITDKISPSGRIIRDPSSGLHGAMGTEKLNTQKLVQEANSNETTLLTQEPSYSEETTLLTAEFVSGGETTLLYPENSGNETTVLNANYISNFVVEYEITYIHTAEVIA